MNSTKTIIGTSASALVGVPFRLFGRSPDFGLDCVGLVLSCLKSAGITLPEVPDYHLKNADPVQLIDSITLNGFMAIRPADAWECGDIIAALPGPAQLHLLIAISHIEFVHAHAGLKRVVCTRGPLTAPIRRVWRYHEKD